MHRDDEARRNMYGCLPCPKCKSKYRTPLTDGTQECPDCGLLQAWDDYLESRLGPGVRGVSNG